MRNEQKISSAQPPRSTPATTSARRTPPANAFSPAYLLKAPPPEEAVWARPGSLAGGAVWAGPWDVKRVDEGHGSIWAVHRLGEPPADGAATVARYRERQAALLYAASLPSLAVANHLRVGESARRLGVPVHDGDRCIGHVTHPHPAFPDHLHVVRSLLNDPRSLALALSALDREELAILGRALMRHAA